MSWAVLALNLNLEALKLLKRSVLRRSTVRVRRTSLEEETREVLGRGVEEHLSPVGPVLAFLASGANVLSRE